MNIELLYQMEMIRKRRLGGYSPATGYRTTDLVVHLDAIQNTRNNGHVSDASVWENLANKFDVTLYNATWGKNYCSFSGNTDSYGIGDSWNFQKGFTIEVVFSVASSGVNRLAGWNSGNASNHRKSIIVYDTGVLAILYSTGNNYALHNTIIPINQLVYGGGSVGFVMFNGQSETHTPLSLKTGFTTYPLVLAARFNFDGSAIDGNMASSLCALRVYDDNLTAEELYAHWLIDKKRFNIPD